MEEANSWNSMSAAERDAINDELDKLNAEAAKLEGRAQYQERKKGTEYDAPITPADIDKLRKMGGLSINKFTSKDIDATAKWATRFYKELGTKSPFFRAWFGEWRAYDALHSAYATPIPATANISYANRTVENADTKWTVQITKDTMEDSIHHAGKERPYMERLLSEIDTVLKRAVLLDTAVSEKNTANKKGSTQFMHYLYSVVEFNGNPFLAKITVEEYGNEGTHRAYNVARIKMSTLSRAQYSQMKSAYRGSFASNVDALNVADLVGLVKLYDSKYQPNPVIKDLLNEDGTPKVVYHGTAAKFYTFKKSKIGSNYGEDSTGFFFASNREEAEWAADDAKDACGGKQRISTLHRPLHSHG